MDESLVDGRHRAFRLVLERFDRRLEIRSITTVADVQQFGDGDHTQA